METSLKFVDDVCSSSGAALQQNLAQFHTGLENEGRCRSACPGTFRCRPQRPVDVDDPSSSISCLTWYLWRKMKGRYFTIIYHP